MIICANCGTEYKNEEELETVLETDLVELCVCKECGSTDYFIKLNDD